MKKINLVECTLRDGGYYNNWDFDRKLVQDYLDSLQKIGISYVEMGFRSFQSKDFKGPNWYTTDNYIKSFKIPKKIKVGVMVNAFELISHPSGFKNAVNTLFKNKKLSRVDFVRLACHFTEFSKTLEVAKLIKKKGYLVAVNFMQISERSEKEVLDAAKMAQEAKIDILYFADSLGSMDNKYVKNIIKIFKKKWSGNIGIHTHNNLGLALSNTTAAIKEGVNWVDSAVMGMGRGAGNAQTEYLLLELDKFKNNFQNNLSLLKLIKLHFEPLHQKYKWGINSYYYLAGKFGIHPTYIQEMLNIKLNENEMIDAISQLQRFGASRYNVNLVRSEFQKPIKLKKGSWSPKGKIKGREVLLVSSGPHMMEYKAEIEFAALLEGEDSPSVEELRQKLSLKAAELKDEADSESTTAIKNVLADVVATIGFVLVCLFGRDEIRVLRGFFDEVVYGLSDNAKAFVIILFTDIFVGFHSPEGWTVLLQGISSHLGIPAEEQFIDLFIATFPVILATIFKYWIFRYLNRVSPSSVATLRGMNGGG